MIPPFCFFKKGGNHLWIFGEHKSIHCGGTKSEQLILVTSEDWKSTTGTLTCYIKKNQSWQIVGKPWTISLSKKGMTWGRGIHASTQDGPQKKERDLTAPAGVFRVGKSYVYSNSPPKGTTWPYQKVDSSWVCVDDPTSKNGAYPSSSIERVFYNNNLIINQYRSIWYYI